MAIKIDDNRVSLIWVSTCDCEDGGEECSVNPDWLEDNGTPTCSCGSDFKYQHTEVNLTGITYVL